MKQPASYWRDVELRARRNRYINEEGYEEFEGCFLCLREKHRDHTMAWTVVPIKKCAKHPKFNVQKALLAPVKEVIA